ncbi:sugar phosphate isomerase/epimerase [Paenibacillus sp. N1-5-1-14]|uniref:sugar phosphate isomerase/epimerase n=1 Tax=Paenibacillus radicibacter TaxID=2972488 RepID=UPI002159AD1D|nr:sugar phosphate isomerase/epimerase [Paenibacillus radicibacter]MCR8641652.1 sugar phosphate isomerase/epimerase [Paenibacillus radicibacter]
MKRFMIGQYGGFDYSKFSKDFRSNFYGIENCLFETTEDELNLVKEARELSFQIGVHYPFRANPSRLRDAPFLASDVQLREEAFEHALEEIEYLQRIQPEYVLFHYPKPVILDDRVDWSRWRFTDSREYVKESNYSYEELVQRTETLFQWLTKQSERFSFIPVLELDALNRYIYETDFLEKLLQKYPAIRLCLDTGRLYSQETIDPNFDSRQIIRTYAKYAHSIHLWNFQFINGEIKNHRCPVLPEHDPIDGWAPIEEYLTIIRDENPDVRIMFEHNSSLISEEKLEECYKWVERMLHYNSVKI